MIRRPGRTGPAQQQLRARQLPTLIRSVQRGTITLNNVTSNTATVTAVDPNNAILTCLGWTDANTGTDLRSTMMAVVLTNSTTITATVNLAVAIAHVISYELIEYWPGVVKSIQRGVLTSTTTVSATATLPIAVNPLKAHLVWGGWTTNDTTAMQDNVLAGRLDLTNATTVTFTKATALGTWLVPYQVVDWL